MAKSYITQEGYLNLKNKLDDLRTNGRAEVAQAIAEAREKGDLSENAEYDAAKDAQGMLELEINNIETLLANAEILDKSQLDGSKVTVLSTVRMMNLKINKEVKYTLVSESEQDLKAKKISVDSPIGKGLLGKVVGDVAEIEVPAGKLKFEILEITIE